MRHTRPARIGIVGMGHAVYWPQFPGLKEELEKKQKAFALYFSPESELVDLGFADDVDSSFLVLKRALASDLDALFIVMATYVPSAVAFPLIPGSGKVSPRKMLNPSNVAICLGCIRAWNRVFPAHEQKNA